MRRIFPARPARLLLGLLLVVTACTAAPAPTPTPTPDNGVRVIEPGLQINDFTLTGTDGQPVNFAALRAKPMIVTFGFTHCPDVCPITLAKYAEIARELGADAEKVTFVWISVDGTRDTPEVIGSYIRNFNTPITGLTGDENTVRIVARDFGATFMAEKPTGTETSYTVNHTASSFFVTPAGQLTRIYSYEAPAGAIVDDVRRNLASG